MQIKHTQLSLKLFEFLEKYPRKWHSISKDKTTKNAFQRLQELYGSGIMEFDAFTNQMRYMPKDHNDGIVSSPMHIEKGKPSNPAHTPTPWKLEESQITGDNGNVAVVNLFGAMSGENTDADAAFIVRAVNAHEEWKDFLSKVAGSACLHQVSGDRCICFRCEACRLLIAKAEGR